MTTTFIIALLSTYFLSSCVVFSLSSPSSSSIKRYTLLKDEVHFVRFDGVNPHQFEIRTFDHVIVSTLSESECVNFIPSDHPNEKDSRTVTVGPESESDLSWIEIPTISSDSASSPTSCLAISNPSSTSSVTFEYRKTPRISHQLTATQATLNSGFVVFPILSTVYVVLESGQVVNSVGTLPAPVTPLSGATFMTATQQQGETLSLLAFQCGMSSVTEKSGAVLEVMTYIGVPLSFASVAGTFSCAFLPPSGGAIAGIIILAIVAFFAASPAFIYLCQVSHTAYRYMALSAGVDKSWVIDYFKRMKTNPVELYSHISCYHLVTRSYTTGSGKNRRRRTRRVRVTTFRGHERIRFASWMDHSKIPDFVDLPDLLRLNCTLKLDFDNPQSKAIVMRQHAAFIQLNQHRDKRFQAHVTCSFDGFVHNVSFSQTGSIPSKFRPGTFMLSAHTFWNSCQRKRFNRAFKDLDFDIRRTISCSATLATMTQIDMTIPPAGQFAVPNPGMAGGGGFVGGMMPGQGGIPMGVVPVGGMMQGQGGIPMGVVPVGGMMQGQGQGGVAMGGVPVGGGMVQPQGYGVVGQGMGVGIQGQQFVQGMGLSSLVGDVQATKNEKDSQI